jgi:hypothetical protein
MISFGFNCRILFADGGIIGSFLRNIVSNSSADSSPSLESEIKLAPVAWSPSSPISSSLCSAGCLRFFAFGIGLCSSKVSKKFFVKFQEERKFFR